MNVQGALASKTPLRTYSLCKSQSAQTQTTSLLPALKKTSWYFNLSRQKWGDTTLQVINCAEYKQTFSILEYQVVRYQIFPPHCSLYNISNNWLNSTGDPLTRHHAWIYTQIIWQGCYGCWLSPEWWVSSFYTEQTNLVIHCRWHSLEQRYQWWMVLHIKGRYHSCSLIILQVFHFFSQVVWLGENGGADLSLHILVWNYFYIWCYITLYMPSIGLCWRMMTGKSCGGCLKTISKRGRRVWWTKGYFFGAKRFWNCF